MSFEKAAIVEGERRHFLAKHTLDFFAEGSESPRFKEYLRLLEQTVNNRDNYIDKGGAGEVYAVGKGQVCIKLMPERRRKDMVDAYDQPIEYNLGNSVKTEAWFLEELSDFKVEEVRTPALVEYLEGNQYTAIVMERLEALNLQHILNGTEELPENFDLDDFFDRVEDYIYALHDEKNIAHGDLEPRNIMLDLKTGHPRIIDFGRSRFLGMLKPEERHRLEAQEIKMIDKVRNEFKNYMNKSNQKLYV